MQPFSVLIPVYKNDNIEHFKAAIRSISSDQTVKPSQIVISVDGPLPDKLNDYVVHLESEPNIVCVWSAVNNGLGIALNKGLEQCSYDIVARMDSDDVAFPTRFEKQLRLMESNDLISTNLAEFSDSIRKIDSIRGALTKELISKKYWILNPFNHPSVMFRKSAVMRAGGYVQMPFFEDWYLWIRMIALGARCDNLNEALVYFRSDLNQLNRRRGINYLKKEIHFVRTLKRENYISFTQYCTRVIVSIPFRLLPVEIFKIITKLFLRK